MQFRLLSDMTLEECVQSRAWRRAALAAVHACLWVVLIALVSDRLRLCQPTVFSLRDRLGHADGLPILCAPLALRRMLVPGLIGVCMIENATISEREIAHFRCQQSMGSHSGGNFGPVVRLAAGSMPRGDP